MSNVLVKDPPSGSVRTVLYLSPATVSYIHSFPQRKRSKEAEKVFQEFRRRQEIHDGYHALLKARELLKGTATTKQVVEWIRKDRRSH